MYRLGVLFSDCTSCRFNDVTEARLATLPQLNRMAARLESALTGLELGDWFCLCLGYGKSFPGQKLSRFTI